MKDISLWYLVWHLRNNGKHDVEIKWNEIMEIYLQYLLYLIQSYSYIHYISTGWIIYINIMPNMVKTLVLTGTRYLDCLCIGHLFVKKKILFHGIVEEPSKSHCLMPLSNPILNYNVLHTKHTPSCPRQPSTYWRAPISNKHGTRINISLMKTRFILLTDNLWLCLNLELSQQIHHY